MFRRIIVVLIVLFGVGNYRVSAQQDDSSAADVVTEINAWRIAEGIWPLRQNATLQAMAVAQAEYILSLPDIPDGGAIHTGRQGEGPKERAQQFPYNWPVYGRTDRVAVDEIGYVGRDAKAAVGFWQSSSIHRTTALNPVYREIGVASLPHPYGHVFIAVLGGRPNVLPATVNQDQVYLSNERFYAPGGDEWIFQATEIRLFDADGKPLSDGWIPWTSVMRVPPNVGGTLYIEYSDQKVQVISEVSLGGSAAPELVVIPPTVTSPEPVPVSEPVETGVEPEPTEAEPEPLVVVVPTAAPTIEPAGDDVLVIYDAQSLTVFNNSSGPLDLSGLVLAQGSLVLPAARWESPWLNAPLNAFPTQDCLRIWSWDESVEPPTPPNCRYQRSVFYVDPEQRFWTMGQFEVRWQNTVLAVCNAQDGLCAVALP